MAQSAKLLARYPTREKEPIVSNRNKLPLLSFDCYDTLVRYSESKASALENIVRSNGRNNDAVAMAQNEFETQERRIQSGSFQFLNIVLRQSLRKALAAVELPCTDDNEKAIIDAVCSSPPFPDVSKVLADLKLNFRLAILSNSEPDIIRHNMIRIGVGMDAIVLASDAKCYKPAPGMFNALLARINAKPKDVTHIAQSFYHDICPAKDHGFGQRIWINRYKREGDKTYLPDHELSNLTELQKVLKYEN